MCNSVIAFLGYGNAPVHELKGNFMSSKQFRLTEHHLKLIRELNVNQTVAEWEGPRIDAKRPYGNSDGPADVCRVLGWEKLGDDGHSPCWSSMQLKEATVINAGMGAALSIVLSSGSFDVEGLYEMDSHYNWNKIDG